MLTALLNFFKPVLNERKRQKGREKVKGRIRKIKESRKENIFLSSLRGEIER